MGPPGSLAGWVGSPLSNAIMAFWYSRSSDTVLGLLVCNFSAYLCFTGVELLFFDLFISFFGFFVYLFAFQFLCLFFFFFLCSLKSALARMWSYFLLMASNWHSKLLIVLLPLMSACACTFNTIAVIPRLWSSTLHFYKIPVYSLQKRDDRNILKLLYW